MCSKLAYLTCYLDFDILQLKQYLHRVHHAINTLNLKQAVTTVTRTTKSSQTLIDHIVNNLPKCRGFRVTDGINKGPLVPFSGGGGRSKRVPPQKNAIFSILGTKFENKRACFSFKEI